VRCVRSEFQRFTIGAHRAILGVLGFLCLGPTKTPTFQLGARRSASVMYEGKLPPVLLLRAKILFLDAMLGEGDSHRKALSDDFPWLSLAKEFDCRDLGLQCYVMPSSDTFGAL
jgi:hypothetical protein